jgi:hypothetical protein
MITLPSALLWMVQPPLQQPPAHKDGVTKKQDQFNCLINGVELLFLGRIELKREYVLKGLPIGCLGE